MLQVDDLTRETPERVIAICRALVGLGAVLHGGNAKPVLQVLEPRQANDAAKASGNLCAVYASVCVEAVLMHAVLDRAYLSRRFVSYTVGYRPMGAGCRFRATDEVLALMRKRDGGLFSDGFVYVLDARQFERCEGSASESAARKPQMPQRVLKVGHQVGWFLMDCPGVEGYAAADAARLDAHAGAP